MTDISRTTHDGRRARGNVMVFLALAALTAIELVLTQVGLAASAATAVFLILSLGKATLVVMFFMHLRQDSRIYTAIFLLPVILVLAFSTLMLMSAGGH
jgi:cytochrome c oxidase subunit IV